MKPTRDFGDNLDDLFVDRSTSGSAKTKKVNRRSGTDPSKPALPGRVVDRYRSVQVKKIIVPDLVGLDYDLACNIAESAQIVGFIQPIAVRRVKVESDDAVRTKIVVVAGAHRLQAARFLGHDRIDCKFIESDDEAFAQLVEIGEQLFRKHLTVLSQSELITKWYELVFADRVSGQDGQKRKRGRPRGGDSEAARTLPIGRSEDARRKIIQRAKKIAGLSLEAKKAVIDAKLENNQKALLAIAKVPGGKAQLNKIASLVKDSGDVAAETDTEGEPGRTNSKAPKKRREHSTETGHPDTTFAQLVKAWDKHFRQLWKYTPQIERDQFITMLRRARRKAHTDVLAFVTDVFMGREKVFAGDLYSLAAKRGLPRKGVLTIVKSLGHYRKRTGGYGRRDRRTYFRNRNSDWKNELPKISHSVLTGRTPENEEDPTSTNTLA